MPDLSRIFPNGIFARTKFHNLIAFDMITGDTQMALHSRVHSCVSITQIETNTYARTTRVEIIVILSAYVSYVPFNSFVNISLL